MRVYKLNTRLPHLHIVALIFGHFLPATATRTQAICNVSIMTRSPCLQAWLHSVYCLSCTPGPNNRLLHHACGPGSCLSARNLLTNIRQNSHVTGFYRILPFFYRILPDFTGFYRILPVFAGFCRTLPEFTGFYRVLLGRTQSSLPRAGRWM